MKYKEFQRTCKYREWESFGHYKCLVTGKGCPRSQSNNCPRFKSMTPNIMKKERRQKLKRAVFLHITNVINGDLQDWDNLEVWLGFEFANEEERNIAADMFIAEEKRLLRRIGVSRKETP